MEIDAVSEALAALEQGKEDEARRILANSRGVPDVDGMLGVMLCNGIGGELDEAEGLKLLEGAVAAGDALAAFNLGAFLLTSNRDRARELFKLSYRLSGKKMLSDDWYE